MQIQAESDTGNRGYDVTSSGAELVRQLEHRLRGLPMARQICTNWAREIHHTQNRMGWLPLPQDSIISRGVA